MKTFTKQEILTVCDHFLRPHMSELLNNRESVTLADIIAMPIPRNEVIALLCHCASPRTLCTFARAEDERAMELIGRRYTPPGQALVKKGVRDVLAREASRAATRAAVAKAACTSLSAATARIEDINDERERQIETLAQMIEKEKNK